MSLTTRLVRIWIRRICFITSAGITTRPPWSARQLHDDRLAAFAAAPFEQDEPIPLEFDRLFQRGHRLIASVAPELFEQRVALLLFAFQEILRLHLAHIALLIVRTRVRS